MRIDESHAVAAAEPHRRSQSTPAAQARAALAELFPRWSLGEGDHAPELRQAIADFQVQRGLSPTGLADGETLSELERAVSQRQREVAATHAGPAGRPSAASNGAGVPADTATMMLERSVSASAPRTFGVAPREPSPVEQIALQAFLDLPGIDALRDFAREHGVTIVIGVGTDRSVGARAFGSAGVYFGPNGEVGFTGSAGIGVALQIGASGTAQVTILNGGIECLEGRFSMGGVSVGQGLVGGAAVVFDGRKQWIGVSVEVGLGFGVAPLEVYVQDGLGVAGDPIEPATR
jgi:hypothetical protein